MKGEQRREVIDQVAASSSSSPGSINDPPAPTPPGSASDRPLRPGRLPDQDELLDDELATASTHRRAAAPRRRLLRRPTARRTVTTSRHGPGGTGGGRKWLSCCSACSSCGAPAGRRPRWPSSARSTRPVTPLRERPAIPQPATPRPRGRVPEGSTSDAIGQLLADRGCHHQRRPSGSGTCGSRTAALPGRLLRLRRRLLDGRSHRCARARTRPPVLPGHRARRPSW